MVMGKCYIYGSRVKISIPPAYVLKSRFLIGIVIAPDSYALQDDKIELYDDRLRLDNVVVMKKYTYRFSVSLQQT
jgi:hypothetical protein